MDYRSLAWCAWRKCLGAFFTIIKPIWNMLYVVYFNINSTGKQIKQRFDPLYKAYARERRILQDSLNRLSGHSTAGCAIVKVINAAAMFLKITLAVEFFYHFRPFYWKTTRFFTFGIYLCLVFIGRATVWIYSGICSILCFILPVVVKLLLTLTSQLISAVHYTISTLLKNTLLALNGIARVSRILVTQFPITDLVRNNWKSPMCGVIVIFVTYILMVLVWRRYKRGNVEELNSVTYASDLGKNDSLSPSIPVVPTITCKIVETL